MIRTARLSMHPNTHPLHTGTRIRAYDNDLAALNHKVNAKFRP